MMLIRKRMKPGVGECKGRRNPSYWAGELFKDKIRKIKKTIFETQRQISSNRKGQKATGQEHL